MAPIVIPNTDGMSTHANDLAAQPGSTAVADNVTFDREGRPERRRGFKDYSTNLPDFTPEQLIASADGTLAYLHLDNGIWYNSGGTWYRKRGSFGAKATNPYGCVVLNGVLYYTANNCVFGINLSSGAVFTVAGRFGISASTNGTGDAARFTGAKGITTDGTDLFVVETYTIRRVAAPLTAGAGVVTTIAGTAGASGGTDATGAAARFNAPSGILYLSGSLIVSSTKHLRRVAAPLTAGAGVVTSIAGDYPNAGSSDGTGTAALFSSCAGLTTDGTNVYVADGNRVRKVSPPLTSGSGVVVSVAGQYGTSGSADGIGTSATINNSWGLSFDGANVLFSDYSNMLIRKLYVGTAYVSTVAGIAGISAASAPTAYADGIIVGPT